MEWARVNLPVVRVGTCEFGTASGIFTTGNVRSPEPVKNWQSEWHDHYEIQGQFFASDQWVRRYWSGYGCTVACSKLGRVKSGKRAGFVGELPDYEAGALEGTNFAIWDINEMLVTASKPDDLGLDLISAGNVCGWACEAQEKSILTAADLGGIQLKWGEADGFLKLMDAIAYRKGGEIITLQVADDGCGFAPDQVKQQKDQDRPRLGLLSMQERLQLIGGELHITSAPGKGTLIAATVPLQTSRSEE